MDSRFYVYLSTVNMNKLLFLLTIFAGQVLVACPNCAGSENAQDKYTVYILAGFIVLTYIPFYLLFKLATKKNPHWEEPTSDS